jgi:hypothetical protein
MERGRYQPFGQPGQIDREQSPSGDIPLGKDRDCLERREQLRRAETPQSAARKIDLKIEKYATDADRAPTSHFKGNGGANPPQSLGIGAAIIPIQNCATPNDFREHRIQNDVIDAQRARMLVLSYLDDPNHDPASSNPTSAFASSVSAGRRAAESLSCWEEIAS